jgi:hypothetical protein
MEAEGAEEHLDSIIEDAHVSRGGAAVAAK